MRNVARSLVVGTLEIVAHAEWSANANHAFGPGSMYGRFSPFGNGTYSSPLLGHLLDHRGCLIP